MQYLNCKLNLIAGTVRELFEFLHICTPPVIPYNSPNVFGVQDFPDISQLLDTLLCHAESAALQAMHETNSDSVQHSKHPLNTPVFEAPLNSCMRFGSEYFLFTVRLRYLLPAAVGVLFDSSAERDQNEVCSSLSNFVRTF